MRKPRIKTAGSNSLNFSIYTGSLATCLALWMGTMAQATVMETVMELDLGDAAGSTPPPAGWGTINSVGGMFTHTSGVRATTGGTWQIGSDAMNTPPAYAVSHPDLVAASEDVMSSTTTNVPGTVLFEFLNPASIYKVEVVSSGVQNFPDRLGDITVQGSFADSGGDPAPHGDDYNYFSHGFNTTDPLVWHSVSPNGSGEILLSATPVPGPDASQMFINAIRVTVVPEPATVMMLLSVLLVLLLVWRRKRAA